MARDRRWYVTSSFELSSKAFLEARQMVDLMPLNIILCGSDSSRNRELWRVLNALGVTLAIYGIRYNETAKLSQAVSKWVNETKFHHEIGHH